MKNILIPIFVLVSTILYAQTEIYTDFLLKQELSAKDYIIQLFDKNDIVIICERAHPETTQYELLLDIISDKRFIDEVGTVCTEIGSCNLNEQTNNFITTKFISDENRYSAVLDISRNLTFYEFHKKYNYTDFLLKLNILNNQLDYSQYINLKMIDIPFSWDSIQTVEDYAEIDKEFISNRDSLMASHIIQEYEKNKKTKRNKMLVVLNNRHAFGPFKFLDGTKPDNTARYVFEKYPSITANVLINQFAYIKEKTKLEFIKVKNGEWDLAFEKASVDNVGFNFKNSPFGKDKFDMFPYRKTDLIYKEVFTGFVFWKPLEKHKLSLGIPNAFNDKFIEEYKRRCYILNPNKIISDDEINILNRENILDYQTIEGFMRKLK